MITIPTGDLTGILADVIPFAFPDDDMPTINCVRLEWTGTRLVATATDRFRVGVSEWEPGDLDPGVEAQDDLFTRWGSGDDPWSAVVDLADAKELVKVFRLGPKEWSVPVTVDLDRLRLTVKRARETGHSAITVVVETGEHPFPDIGELLGKNDVVQPVTGLAFTARMLADFAKVRPRGPLEMRFTGETELVHVSVGERFHGAIMPVRIGDGDG